jgi:DNA polymerase-3 subunit beta
MKFSCTQENLKKGLMITGSVASRNLNLPILNNVLIRVEENTIRFLSTNLEIAVRYAIRGKVEAAGETTLPSKLFLDYVNLLPDDRVDIETEGEDGVVVSCRKHTTRIKGLPTSEFPLIPEVERKTVFALSGTALKNALSQVAFAVSNVESRPELTGVLFSLNPEHAPGKVVLAATDSYRLSERTIPLEQGSTNRQTNVIVPGKTLHELSRILGVFKDGDDALLKVEIALGENQAVFSFGEVELISRLIDGKYPDYRPIIPDGFASEALISRQELVQAVKGASLFSRAGLQDVHLEIQPKGGVRVSSGSGQMGKNESVIEAETSGKANSAALNFRYLLDGLAAIDDLNVRLKFIDAMNPCVLAPGDERAEGKFIYIVMPIKQ